MWCGECILQNPETKHGHVIPMCAIITPWKKTTSFLPLYGYLSGRRLINMNISYTMFLCPSQTRRSKPEIRQTALLATRSAACLWNKVWLAYSREFKVLEAMLTAIDIIARCESGCQPPRVDRGIGNSFTAKADSCRTLPNLLIFSSHAFLSRFSAFSIPSRTRAGERGWQNVISNISEPPWLPNALISGRSLWRPNGRGSKEVVPHAMKRVWETSRTGFQRFETCLEPEPNRAEVFFST